MLGLAPFYIQQYFLDHTINIRSKSMPEIILSGFAV